MKPLIIDCSPREGGNCDSILQIIKANFDVDSYVLREYDYMPCNGCGCCDKSGKCRCSDYATTILKDMEGRDKIIFVAPVYFYSFDAHTKALIDRTQYKWNVTNKSNDKKIYLIAVGGQNFEYNFEPMIKTLKSFAITFGGKYLEGLFFRGIEDKNTFPKKENVEQIIDFCKRVFENIC